MSQHFYGRSLPQIIADIQERVRKGAEVEITQEQIEAKEEPQAGSHFWKYVEEQKVKLEKDFENIGIRVPGGLYAVPTESWESFGAAPAPGQHTNQPGCLICSNGGVPFIETPKVPCWIKSAAVDAEVVQDEQLKLSHEEK